MRAAADFDYPRTVIWACRLVLAELGGDEQGRNALFVELVRSGGLGAVIGFFVGTTAKGLREQHGTAQAIDIVTSRLAAAVLAAAGVAETP